MRVRLALVLCVSILTGSSLSASASEAATTKDVQSSGKQVMPLLMNNSFVLFPGEKAPFIKNNRLMVPLQTITPIMGWITEEKGTGSDKHYNVWPMTEDINSVGGLQEGLDWAVYKGDMGYGIGAKPEYRAGELYVPLTPLLDGMPSYSYEIQSYGQNKVLAVKDTGTHWMLNQVQDSDVQQPQYPDIRSNPAYPLIPTFLNQRAITVNGKSQYRLLMNMKQLDNGSGGEVESIALKIMAVSDKGVVTTLNKSLPYLGDGLQRAIVFDVPNESAYVLVQSHYEYKNGEQPTFDVGYPLQAAMASAMAKAWASLSIFEKDGLYPVSFQIESNETVITIHGQPWVQQEITEQQKHNLIQSIYRITGHSFPIRVEVEQRSEQSDD